MHRGILFQQLHHFWYSPQDSRDLPSWHDTPSWSWATLNKPVTWVGLGFLDHTHNNFTNIDIVQCLGSTRLRLRETFIICLGEYPSFRSAGNENNLATHFVGMNQSGFQLHFFLDQWFAMTFGEYPSKITSIDARDERLTTNKDEQSLLERTVIVPITYCAWYSAEFKNIVGDVWCLLLYAPPRAEEGVYRRAGVVAASNFFGSWEDIDAAMIKAQFDAYRRPVARKFFQEEDDQGNHTVTVM